MLVNINPKIVDIDDGVSQYNDTYENFVAHAVGYFTTLPIGCLQYHRSGDPKSLEYVISNVSGQVSQVAAAESLVTEVDLVLINLDTIIAVKTEANTPEAELDLLPSPAINTVLYGQELIFNLLYNKVIPPSYTLDIEVTSSQGFPNIWTINIDNAIEPLNILFSQKGLWSLDLLGVKYMAEVQ